jgi:hypothetical protein
MNCKSVKKFLAVVCISMMAWLSASCVLGQDSSGVKVIRCRVVLGDRPSIPVGDVEVLLVAKRHSRFEPLGVTILDRQHADASGNVELHAPLSIDLLKASLECVVMPTRETAIHFGDSLSRYGFAVDLVNVGARTLYALPRNKLRLKIKDQQGNSIPNAQVVRMEAEGVALDEHFFQAVPELQLAKSNADGELVIDFCYVSRNLNIQIAHPKFATHRFHCESAKMVNGVFEAEITLVPGTSVKVTTKDLRTQKNDERIKMIFEERAFELDPTRGIEVPIDWRNVTRAMTSVLLNDPYDRYEITPSLIEPTTKEVTITLYSTDFLQGFARDVDTGVPLANRRIWANSAAIPSVIESTQTQHDGYFRLRVPKVAGDLDIQLFGMDTIEPDRSITLTTTTSAEPLHIHGKSSVSNRLQILTSDGSPASNVVLEHGDNSSSDSAWEVSRDGWIETKLRSLNLIPLEAYSMDSMKSAKVTADSANSGSFTMQDELSVIGRVTNQQHNPCAWQYPTLTSTPWMGPKGIRKSCNSSSEGRFVFTGLLHDRSYELKTSDSQVVLEIELQNKSVKTPDLFANEPDTFVPMLYFHVDYWIYGPKLSRTDPRTRPLLVVTHCATTPYDRTPIIDRLHFLSTVYPELDILLVYLMEPFDLKSIQSELQARGCRFSVGIDRACKTREFLPVQPTLFMPETGEVFSLSNLRLRPIRDIMLYLRKAESNSGR